MKPVLYLFDDRVARGWEPFAASRPAGELFFGALLLRERVERYFGMQVSGYLATPGLEGFTEPGAPPSLNPAESRTASPRILLLARALFPILPHGTGAAPLPDVSGSEGGLLADQTGAPLGWYLPPGAPFPGESELLGIAEGVTRIRWQERLPVRPDPSEIGAGGPGHLRLPATRLEAPWEIPVAHAAQLRLDLEALYPGGRGSGAEPLADLPGVHRIGAAPVSVETGVSIDPGAVLDTRNGPIHLSSGVRISPLSWLKGPSKIGPGSTLLGGTFDSIVCGPVCRLRGEIEESVILGYSNKAHDGYLGHALLGRWVNLGAMTTNSDLKNNYGSIRVGHPSGDIDTGLMKMGALLGDHVKLGIGTLLDAGTAIGTGSNVFGGGFPGAKWIPPFSWGGARGFRPYDLSSFLDTAATAMGRRGVELTDADRAFLTRIWERIHGGRRSE